MGTIYIDGKPYKADPEQNLLHACLSLGFDLPYFCWHAALGSVGACRQCAVKHFKDAKDTHGKIVMACMTPAVPETRISILDPEAAAFRAGIIEGMMLNHPHDCPVCDEGGECHLQDMTVMTGHNYRRTRFEKRTFHDQYLGPFVYHEMNRCIQCYRCVRFYREYAGGSDLNSFGIGNEVYFGRDKDGVLESEFAGNLVEVCPTGVFTDRTLRRHYTRKWDLRMAPSICAHCSVGCNVTIGERYGLLRRVLTRFNSEVNGYFLCDRGRFGYEFVNSERRIRAAKLDGEFISSEEAKRQLQSLVSSGNRPIGIGSPRASLEANFALRRMVGKDRFFAGMADGEWETTSAMVEILQAGPARSPSLHDIELSDAVLILGEDVTNSAPRMALSLRQSVRQQPLEIVLKLHVPLWMDAAVRDVMQDRKGPLFIAAPGATRLDDVATRTYRAAPDDVARLGFAVAHEIDPAAPEVVALTEEVRELARIIAGALKTAKRPMVISGASCRSRGVIESAANVARALCNSGHPAGLSFIAPECNSFGLALMGARPLREAFSITRNGEAAPLIILENDLYRHFPANSVDSLLGSATRVVVLDHLENKTTAKADLLLPASTFAESAGTLVSNEGRAQRFFPVFPQPNPEDRDVRGDARESWRWLGDPAWLSLDDVLATVAKDLPQLAPIVRAAPPAKFRMAGAKIPRESHRSSGLTSITANISVVEPRPPDDPDSALAYSMEGDTGQPPGALQPFFWTPGWNSIQAVNKFQSEIGDALRGGDPGVRLFDARLSGDRSSQPAAYFTAIPAPFTRRDSEWLIVPIEHIFGSEELSLQSPPVAELAPTPYLALSAVDASALHMEGGTGEVEIELGGVKQRLPLKVLPDLPAGIAGIPAGLTTARGEELPAWSRIERVP
ncbi:MAG TPA: NADH-quinone oxidoreductase subunit NuoG [Acidobacteriaceae bacterium]